MRARSTHPLPQMFALINCTRRIRATTYAAIFARFTGSTHDRPLLWAARGRRGVLLTVRDDRWPASWVPELVTVPPPKRTCPVGAASDHHPFMPAHTASE